MLDYEEGFVVVGRIAKGVLGGKDAVKVEVAAVIHSVGEVLLDRWLEWSGHEKSCTCVDEWEDVDFTPVILRGQGCFVST